MTIHLIARLFALAVFAAVIGVVIVVVFAGSNERSRRGWRFAAGTFIGLAIAGVSLGHLVTDVYKKPAWGLWLGIGVWITLVTTVRAIVAPRDRTAGRTTGASSLAAGDNRR